MATSGTIGTGCSLSIDPANGTSWVAIAEVTDITLSQSTTEGDATALDSSGIAQYLAGTQSYTCTFSAVWLPDSHDLTTVNIVTKSQARATVAIKITWNDPSTAATAIFSGFFTSLEIGVPGHDQVCTLSGTVRIGGGGVTFAGLAAA